MLQPVPARALALRAPAHTGNGDSFLLVAVAGALVAAVGGYFVFMA